MLVELLETQRTNITKREILSTNSGIENPQHSYVYDVTPGLHRLRDESIFVSGDSTPARILTNTPWVSFKSNR